MRKFILPVISAATLFAVSCNKVNDTPTYLSEPFALDGKTYATLQEAVDVASGMSVQDAECVISLLSCAEGDGAVISDFPGEALLIDLKGYDYAVKDGGSIRISGSCVDIQSEGGSIIGRGSSPAISLDYSLVNLSKQLRIAAENAISACDESEIYTDGFSGTIEGNISLDGSFFCVLSSDCRISVPLLSVAGEYAAFSAETETVPSSSIVDIQKVASDSGYPVMSFKPGVIRVQDGDVHIHNFTEEYIPGSCIGTGRTQFECKDCGYVTYNFDDKMGTCCPEDLIHHEAKDAEDFEYGYVESWECPACGRFYSDANAQNELTTSPFLYPQSILLGKEILNSLDESFDWDANFNSVQTKLHPVIIIGIIASAISIAQSIAFSIPGLVQSDSDKWVEVFSKLDDIKKQVDAIDLRMNEINRLVQDITVKNMVLNRYKSILSLSRSTWVAATSISNILKDTAKSNKTKEAEIRDALIYWSKEKNNHDLVGQLMSEYSGYGIPAKYGDCVTDICFWEHEGYSLRFALMAGDFAVMEMSYLLARLYINDIKEFEEVASRDASLLSLKNSFQQYCRADTLEVVRMSVRDSLYRVLSKPRATFERTARECNFYSWFYRNKDRYCFPRLNQNGKATASCDQILKDLDLKQNGFITAEEAKKIYYHYNPKKKDISLYDILKDSVHFKNIGVPREDKREQRLFTYQYKDFTNINDDAALPVYSIFQWEIYRYKNHEDQFGISTGLERDATMSYRKVLVDCDISSYSSGCINSIGSSSFLVWKTMVKVP